MNTVPKTSAIVYVDLDHTLIRTDSLFESIAVMLRRSPVLVLMLPLWLLRGRAYLKARLMSTFSPDVSLLPYRDEVLAYLSSQKTQGKRLVLATAANERFAQKVAAHLGIFERVLASSTFANAKGAAKAEKIVRDAAGLPFTYVGDSRADLHVWRHANAAVLVGASKAVRAAAAEATAIEAELPTSLHIRSYSRVVRTHQWAKNLLVFVPIAVSHMWMDTHAIVSSIWAALSFCASASAIYIINDIVDLSSDRHHPRKRLRPFASGAVPLEHGVALLVPLLAIGAVLSFACGPLFSLVILTYVIATLAYSLHLKTFVLVDVLVLAALYTLRILGGAAAISVTPSFWLLAFSMFLFLSLAIVKRCSELLLMERSQRDSVQGRDYRIGDYPVLQGIGIASGFAAVIVFALYVNNMGSLVAYRHPEVLWLICGTLVYWIARMWLKTARGEMHDDPIVYAVKDRGSRIMGILSILFFIAAI